MRLCLTLLPAALCAAPALSAPCPEGTAPALAAPFAAWNDPTPIAAARDAASATALPVGRAVAVTLKPSADIAYAMKPLRAIRPGSFGGVVAVDIPAPGRYRLAMGSFAWADMMEDGQSLKSLERDHSLPCVSKVLDFELKAGRHIIQLADDRTAMTRLMLVPGQKPPAASRPPVGAEP